jgi:methyl-accepting chemotaxis protein
MTFISLRQTKIKTRLYLLLFVTIALFVIPFASMVSDYQKDLMTAKQVKTRQLVEVASGILDHYHQLQINGSMSQEQAQTQAKSAINKLRYETNDYFWINDLTPKMIMHPIKPKLDGMVLSGLKDSNGKALFIEMVNVAKSNGEGFVHYMWPKPGSSVDVGKVSFIKLFKPWGWILGTGVYIDDVNALVMKRVNTMIWFIGSAIAILILLSTIIGRSITRPCEATQHALEEIAKGDGNLSTQLPVEGNDEFSFISKSFNEFTSKIRHSIQGISPISQSISRSVMALNTMSEQAGSKANDQQTSVTSVAAAMTELQSNNQEVSNSAQSAVQAAQIASEKSHNGQQSIAKASDHMSSLSNQLTETEINSQKLAEEANNVGSVLEVIRGVAEQTNLLALNAAIEAARAGEQGRGFAVVADEVRTLATQTQKSTDEIEQIVLNLQSRAKDLSSSMNETQQQSQATLTQAELANKILEEISQQVNEILDMNQHIATACVQQTIASDEITHNLVQFTEYSAQTNKNVHVLTETSEQLLKDSQILNDSFSVFKV